MAAPTGNKFWMLRSKHGRDKLFSTPELLWEAACEYFQWCDENPWLSKKAIQKTVPVRRKKERKWRQSMSNKYNKKFPRLPVRIPLPVSVFM